MSGSRKLTPSLLLTKEKEAVCRQREQQRLAQRMEAQELARHAQEVKLQQRMERERALQVPIYPHFIFQSKQN